MVAVEWLLFELSKNGLLPDGIPSDIHNKAKEMEEEQREKDFIEGYKKRAEIGNSIFDEISETTAKVLFEEMLKSE